MAKYIVEDVGKQKFITENFYQWKMVDDKYIKAQINKYYRLLEDMNIKNINLLEAFIAGILIEKLSNSWSDYKQ